MEATSNIKAGIDFKNQKLIIWSAIFISALTFFAVSISLAGMALDNDNIYAGIFINDTYIGEMSKEQALAKLAAEYENFGAGKSITLSHGDDDYIINVEAMEITLDLESTVEQAYTVGRTGGVISKLLAIQNAKKKTVSIHLSISYNREYLQEQTIEFAHKVEGNGSIFKIDERASRVTIFVEPLGYAMDISATCDKIGKQVSLSQFGVVQPVFATLSTAEEKADMLMQHIYREPQDAKYAVVDNMAVVVPDRNGISLDKDNLLEFLRQRDYSIIQLPLMIKEAEVKAETLQALLFKDVLAEYTTTYDRSIVGRTINVQLAARKMSGTVIGDGDIFSFNDVVGQRSYETGFADGRIFVGSTIVDGVGGGICQVSSTLYNTILFADLEVLERHNHTFAVAYVPMGLDATVAYGALDLKFKNNTGYPIKVESVIGGSSLTIKILGTKADPQRSIDLYNITKSTTPFTVVQKANPNLFATKSVVQQAGVRGATVESYKIIKMNGIEEKRIFLHTSVYKPLEQIVLIPQKSRNQAPEEE